MKDESLFITIADNLHRIGGDDRTCEIFEGMLPIPEGVSYNSYVITDEKTVLLDTCDASVAAGFMDSLKAALQGRALDYFVVNHMEPDHGACIKSVISAYPDAVVVGNARTFEMIHNFYGIQPPNRMEVVEGDVLDTGSRKLVFVFAPMVHWPEVMVTYDSTNGILFSADAFGTFGTLDGCMFADLRDFDRDYLDGARRYYANIVGKYGAKVQSLFKKLEGHDLNMICPLHGPVWRQDFGYILGKYDLWSRYEPEEKGVAIGYVSMYGNTRAAADRLASMLRARGVRNVVLRDLSRIHPSYLVADAFRLTNIVLAAPTYNNSLQPLMDAALTDMENMAVQKRCYSVIGNGSWVPRSHEFMIGRMSKLKDMTLVGEPVVFKSSMNDEAVAALERLADAIAASME